MPLITSSIPNLINGVSQQPPALRLASQAERVINCVPSPVEGLKKRPPFNHIARLFTGSAGTHRPFVHMVDKTNDVSYIVIIQDSAIKVANLDGTLVTPSSPDGLTYLDVAGKPSEQFRVASVADYTFIVNREKEVAMSNDLSKGRISSPTSMIFIKAANYDTEYSVTIDGTEKKYRTPPAGGKEIKGSYVQASNSSTVLVNVDAHGLVTGDTFEISFDVISNSATGATAGSYTVASASTNSFTYTAATQNDGSENSGNCNITKKESLSTITIADEIADQLNTISGFTINNDDYIIHITKDDGSDYDVSSKDDKSGDATKTIKHVVDDLNDLPVKAYEGYIVEVQGSQATRYDNYFLRFSLNKEYQADGTYGDGVWREVSAPNIKYRFDEATMPHVLIRNSDGSFTFKKYVTEEKTATYSQSGTTVTVTSTAHGLSNNTLLLVRPSSGNGTSGVFPIRATAANTFTYTAPQIQSTSGNLSYGYTWSGRIAGDETTAGDPSFVGKAIQNLNLFQNRFVMLADENAILSASDAYGRFWPESVQTIVESDPIDLSTGGTSINFLIASVSFANTLLLFSRHSQFRLDAGANVGTYLSSKSATITAMTSFDMDTSVDPIAVGRNTYFAIPKGSFSGLREFFLPDSSGSIPLSEDVTSSIPRYIPSNLCGITSAVAEDALIMMSVDQPKRIYLYKFFFEEDTKLQSAWSYWEVSGTKTILGGAVKGSDLYVLIEYSDGVYLEKVSLRPEQVDAGTEIEILLDRKTTEPASGSLSLTNEGALGVETVITLPYPITAGAEMIVVGRYEAGNELVQHGQVIEPLSQTSNTITVLGDLKTVPSSGDNAGKTPRFFIGERYTMTYEFSTPFIKEQPSGGGVALAAGPKLQMRTWSVIFDESSAFELKVTPASRDTNTYPYNGVIVGQAPPLIGDPSVLTGSFRVPVMASNIDTKIEISSTSPLPCRFQSAEWEGFYHTRASRQ
mgnify:CR=1 FL=1